MKHLTLLVLILCAIPAYAQQTVTFAWDPHEEAAQITGFKLYQTKQAGVYTQPAIATFTDGSVTTGTIPQPLLGRYYYVLTAFKDDSGYILESDHSNEVSLVLKPKPPKFISAIQTALIKPIGKIYTMVAGIFRPSSFNRPELRIER